MTGQQSRPKTVLVLSALVALTFFRAQTLFFLPELEMYGGLAPDSWFGPWVSDALLGLLVPVIVWLALTKTGTRIWGLLVLYNALGAFDYSQGLITQLISPLPVEVASPAAVYGGILVFLVFQLIALALLFQRNVVAHYTTDQL